MVGMDKFQLIRYQKTYKKICLQALWNWIWNCLTVSATVYWNEVKNKNKD